MQPTRPTLSMQRQHFQQQPLPARTYLSPTLPCPTAPSYYSRSLRDIAADRYTHATAQRRTALRLAYSLTALAVTLAGASVALITANDSSALHTLGLLTGAGACFSLYAAGAILSVNY